MPIEKHNNRILVSSFPGQGWDFGLIRHPFHEEERQRGAKYCVYNRRLMAVCFDDSTTEQEYWLLCRGVGVLHTGEHTWDIRGPDAERFLNRVFSRDVGKQRVGRCAYQFVCYPDGGMLVDGVLLRHAPDHFWFVQADGDLFPWLIAHAQDLDVAISDPGVFVSQVQGPRSLEVLEAAADGGLSGDFHYFDIERVSIAGQEIVATRTGFTNELGWEFYIEPHHNAHALWDHIKAAGKPFSMNLAGLDAYDPRRIEAGIQNAGSDFDKDTTPFAVGLGGFVDLDKPDFIGKAALEQADKTCRQFGLRCEGGTPKIRGRVKIKNVEVGVMTSGAWSPYLECGVGFVRFFKSGPRPGAQIEVDCLDGASHPGLVCSLPMYDEQRRIPRGLAVDIPTLPG